jgi:dTDP-4-dehydrorhamnose reductase
LTLLVLGAGGQIGRALVERGGSRVVGADRARCDIRDAAAVDRLVAERDPSVVVNCAAFTAVDAAERARAEAFAVNADGAAHVARAAARHGRPVIHLSTDYVYDGARPSAHREDEPPAPINAYGASKAAGDAAVAAANPRHIVLRVSWVFGVHGANFVKTMLESARTAGELRVVDDRVGAPTEARDIADAILVMADACGRGFAGWGVYHFAGSPDTTWCRFARAIFEQAKGRAPRVVPIASAERPEDARRPANSALDCSKIAQAFGIERPDWRRSLSRVLAALAETPA